jgi:hypothetical protein
VGIQDQGTKVVGRLTTTPTGEIEAEMKREDYSGGLGVG